MASAVQKLSAYPLVLLTNTVHFPDGTPVAPALRRLNVRVRPIAPVPVPQSLKEEHRISPGCQERGQLGCAAEYLKLQVWRLTEYEKLIWMDTDAILTDSVDGLFHRQGTWAQQDNWDCGSALSWSTRFSPTLSWLVDVYQRRTGVGLPRRQSSGVCSGLVLLEPSEAAYGDLIDFMSTLRSAPNGDQEIIEMVFREVRQEPVQLLDVSTASFGTCLGKGFLSTRFPAFVHKSDRDNVCFRPTASRAECEDHPLGKYWHDHFCHAVATANFTDSRISGFCSPWQGPPF